MTVLLDDRAVIALSGPEARGFLQGLITNDIERLAPGNAIYAALLTPQGKVLFDFLISEGDGALLLDCAISSRDALIKRLSMYRLRAKVMIEARDPLAVVASWDAGLPARIVAFDDPRLPALGRRGITPKAELHTGLRPAAIYQSHRLDLGVPEAADFGQDRMFALDADLDALNAISFDKGCYVGQELTARMKHRTALRKRLLPIHSPGGEPLPPADTPLKAGGRDIGEITSTYGARGFALIRLDRLEEAGAAAIEAAGAPIAVIKPSWLFA
jgi:tRNA-modifying protein YgfZ